MNSNVPKAHHFISQMHAARFTDESGRFYVFNKAAGKVLCLTPVKAFREKHLYTIETAQGVKDTTLEATFSALETQVSEIMDKIVSAARVKKTPNLSRTERGRWDLFFYMQWKRVPDVLGKAASLRDGEAQLDKIFAQLRARYPNRTSEFDALDNPAERRRLLKAGKVQAIGTIRPEALSVLRSRGLAIAHIKSPGEPLVIGSLPIVRMKKDLRDESSEAWLPISSDVAVGLGRVGQPEILIAIDEQQRVRNLNQVIANQSTSFAAASKSLVEELVASIDQNTPGANDP